MTTIILILLGILIGFFIPKIIKKFQVKTKTTATKRHTHNNPEDIFKHAEAWWITNFLAEDKGKSYWNTSIPSGGEIPLGEYAAKFLSNSAACQAFALELYFKCIQVIETGSFIEGHYLINLFNGISKENQNRIIVNHNRIIENHSMHKQYKKSQLLKNKDMSFLKILERSSKAYENYRYIFMSNPKEKNEAYLTFTVHACKILIEELKPEWKPLMATS